RYAGLLPDVLISLGPGEFAALASRVLAPRTEPVLELSHLHVPRVSVKEQAILLTGRLRRSRTATFRSLSADSPDTLTTVSRFLALLELYVAGAVAFEQLTPLGELTIRWTGSDDGDIEVGDEYDASADSEETGIPDAAEPPPALDPDSDGPVQPPTGDANREADTRDQEGIT
ncbi:MAG: segregation/condensation protein A, partial [Nocardioidaceae bacterium]